MIQEKQKLSGKLNNKQSLSGSLSNSVIYVDPITQEKTVIPTAEQQIVTPDKEYTGLSKVTVEAIQDDNLIPENIKNGVDILGVTGNFIGNKYAPRHITFSSYTGTDLDEEITNLDTSNVSKMNSMFYQCSKLTTLDLSNFDTSSVTNMSNMFSYCSMLTNIDLSNFDTSKVTNMGSMFSSCSQLTTLDLTNFNTSNVNSMTYMFYGCRNLTNLDLSNFDTSKVTNMGNMFYSCSQLTTLDLTSFDTSNVTSMNSMFYGCRKLSNIPKLNASKVNNIGFIVDSCTSLTDFGGLENLGQAYLTSYSANYGNYKLDLSTCTALTEQSLINVLTNLYDIKTKGCKPQQLILGSNNLAKLTSEEGQQALASSTEKGWSVS